MQTERERLFFITPKFGKEHGGVGASAFRIVGHLRSQFDITVFVPDKELTPGSTHFEDSLGLSILSFGIFADQKVTSQFCCDLIVAEHNKLNASAVCGFYLSSLSYSALLAARLVSIPFIASARGNDIDLDIFGADAFQIHYILANAHTVICVTSEMEKKILSWSSDARVLLIPNGVDEVEFPLLEKSNLKTMPVVVGLFGEIKAKKGLGLLLEAIDFSTCHLRITGRLDTESSKLLHGFLTLYPELREKIAITPYLKRHLDLLDAYKATDIICIPSLHDGMPNVLLEAMSCGKVVVASDVGGAVDLISQGENGFLFSRGNKEELNQALTLALETLKNPDNLVGINARKTVTEKFNWKIEMNRYCDFFLKLCARP